MSLFWLSSLCRPTSFKRSLMFAHKTFPFGPSQFKFYFIISLSYIYYLSSPFCLWFCQPRTQGSLCVAAG
jgi:hypothetical protein